MCSFGLLSQGDDEDRHPSATAFVARFAHHDKQSPERAVECNWGVLRETAAQKDQHNNEHADVQRHAPKVHVEISKQQDMLNSELVLPHLPPRCAQANLCETKSQEGVFVFGSVSALSIPTSRIFASRSSASPLRWLAT
eukprot:6182395-Amphidinium_carterae.1